MRTYTSLDLGLAKITAPKDGVHDIYEVGVFSTMNHPTNVGLKVEELTAKYGEYIRRRVHGFIKTPIVDTHNNKYMVDKRVLYEAGEYDFVVIQKKPENWSGWF